MIRSVGRKPFVALAVAAVWALGMLGYAISTETPVGTLEGRVVGADTGRPIESAEVRLTKGADGEAVKSVKTDAAGFYKFSQIPAGKYRLESFARVHSLKPSEIEVGEGRREKLNLELAPGDPYFNLFIHQQLFTSDETPEVEFDGFSEADQVRLVVYKIDPDKVTLPEAAPIREMITQGWGSYAGEVERSPVVASKQEKTVDVTGRDSEGAYHQRVSLGRLAPGIYVLTARSGRLAQTGWISVSDLALVTKESGSDLLAYAVRPDSGEPVVGARVSVFESGTSVAGGVTGSDGLLLTKPTRRVGESGAETGRENRLIVGRQGESVAFLTSYSYEPEAGDTSIYSYTDRPVYRPGQLVNFKGIVRRFAGDAYRMPGGGEARVEVRDKRDTLVYAESLKLGRFGSFAGSFKLADYAATGGYDVTCSYNGKEQTASFSVAEYRKPEFSVSVEMPKKRCARGERIKAKIRATYFFGAPVVGAEVHYSVYRSQYWMWPGEEDGEYYGEGEYYDGGGYGEAVVEGTARTGPDGVAEVEFVAYWPRERELYYTDDQQFTVSANVTDQSRSEAMGEGAIIATQGTFSLRVQPLQYVVSAGEESVVEVRALDYDGKPQAGVDVEVSANLTDWDSANHEERFERVAGGTVRTDGAGLARFSFKVEKPGSYVIRVRAKDSKRREIRGSEYVWVTGEGDFGGYNYPDLQVVLDKKSYNPGDVARVMINTKAKGASALVTVEGRRLYDYRVVKLADKSTVVEIPIKAEYRPNFYVSVCYASKKRLAQDEARAKVSLGEKLISLSVTPDKRKYQPGETANYVIKALDGRGRPVQAEVSVGVVDEAIYAIAPDDTTPIRDFFYSAQPNSVSTRYSFPNVYLSGDKGGFTGKVRKDFLDTAYWRADVVTDSRGLARVSVKLPDNLTTWRATARACTVDTAVGQCVSSVVCTKPLLVRLEIPRFLVQGDRALVSAIVHNYTSRDERVNVTLRAPGLRVEGHASSRVRVDRDGTARAEWWVSVLGPGPVTVSAYAVGERAQDAMELTIPVRPHGQREVETRVGTLSGDTTFEKLVIRGDAVSGASEIRVRVAPSLASSLIGSLDYLAAYPYGCTEQTMSGFLPDVVIWRMLKNLGIENEGLKKRLPDMVGRGLNRLYDFQNENGGWGWCEYGEEDIWMTAYVVYGLQTAREAGFAVNDEILRQGIDYLARKVAGQSKVSPNLSYAAYVLSIVGKADVARAKIDLITRTGVGDTYDTALVALTLANLGQGERAREYLRRLWSAAEIDRGEVYWKSRRDWDYDSSNVEVTALAMQVVNRLTPEDPRLADIMRGIMRRRAYNHWSSTRDTAMVIYAASDYLARTKELGADCKVTVFDNGREIGGARFDKASVFAPEREIVIRPRDVGKGSNVIRLVKEGTGTLYYTIEATQYIERDDSPRTITGSGITVSREYRKFVPRWNESLRYNELWPSNSISSRFRSGDTMQVRVIVNSPQEYRHVLVEDYLPAGCEAFDRGRMEPWEWDYWWADMDVRDERVSFYVDTLPKGKSTLQYEMRAWIPGRYNAPGALVQAMYQPEIAGIGAASLMEIGD